MNKKEFKDLIKKCSKEDYVINPNYHISYEDFFNVIAEHFLGKGWYVVEPVSKDQAIAIACERIIMDNKKEKRKSILFKLRNKVKKFTLIIGLLLVSNMLSAQLKPKIAIGYDIKNSIRMANIYGDKMTYYMPNFNFRSGLEYSYKNVSIYYDMQFWCKYENKHTSFSPEQGVFEVGIKYNVTDKIKITINHVCYHPLQTFGDNHNGIYGGHKGITISYGY